MYFIELGKRKNRKKGITKKQTNKRRIKNQPTKIILVKTNNRWYNESKVIQKVSKEVPMEETRIFAIFRPCFDTKF